MSQTVHYLTCPICGGFDFKEALVASDHTVSGERFSIFQCRECTGRFTQDVPAANDIGKYYQSENYISHTNTSEGLINRLYQLVRKRTLKSKRRLLQHITGAKQASLLDIGSGIGAFVNEMKSCGWSITGLEPDQQARNKALDLYQLALNDISEFERLPVDKYDVITMWHVLEHVHALQDYLFRIKGLLKKEGKLVVAVPNYTCADARVYGNNWAAYDVPRHLYHFSPASMKKLMEQNGFTVKQYKPMWYDSFYVSMLSSKYKNGKMRLLPAVFVGLRSNITAMFNVKRCSSVIYVIEKAHK